jgi:hypothetical protein
MDKSQAETVDHNNARFMGGEAAGALENQLDFLQDNGKAVGIYDPAFVKRTLQKLYESYRPAYDFYSQFFSDKLLVD